MQNNNFRDQVASAYVNGKISVNALDRINEIYGQLNNQGPLVGPLALTKLNHAKEKNENSDFQKENKHSKHMENTPKVSFIIPTHNRAELLPRCVDSVLAQNYPNIEIIIIDDCSKDMTQEIVMEKYGDNKIIRYYRNDVNLGPGGNRQKAYKLSTGEFLVFIDDDDFYFEPEFVQTAIEIFYEYKTVGMVCANSIIYNMVDSELQFYPLTFCGLMNGGEFLLGFRTKYRKPNSTFPAIFKKSILEEAGFEDMWMMNDTSIYLRAACFSDVYMLKNWVGCYLVHSSNISKSLPHKFILENLDEKKNIYQLAKKQMKREMDGWYYSQLMDTIQYYLRSAHIGIKNFLSIIFWLEKNGGDEKKELIIDTVKKQYKEICK